MTQMWGKWLLTRFVSQIRLSTMQISIWERLYLAQCRTIQGLVKISELRFRGDTLRVSLVFGPWTKLETKAPSRRSRFQWMLALAIPTQSLKHRPRQFRLEGLRWV